MTTAHPSAWGNEATKYFFALTPEKILEAVEAEGLTCTGRVLQLNSMENRVYEVEVDVDDDSLPRSAAERFRIVKFYRPGRWSKEQILEEHRFLLELQEYEIPAVAPIPFSNGETLKTLDEISIHFCLFPKIGGRSPDELDSEGLQQVGRLLARIHNVGAVSDAPSRIRISPQSYGLDNLAQLEQLSVVPDEISVQYREVVESICEISTPLFSNVPTHRIHGDAHLGNLLLRQEHYFWVDFDDMVIGPAVQDIWLITPGRDEESLEARTDLLIGYEQLRPFDWSSLRLVEALRALRFIHFTAWIAKRWDDPAFKNAFPYYGSTEYWNTQLRDLYEQRDLLNQSQWP